MLVGLCLSFYGNFARESCMNGGGRQVRPKGMLCKLIINNTQNFLPQTCFDDVDQEDNSDNRTNHNTTLCFRGQWFLPRCPVNSIPQCCAWPLRPGCKPVHGILKDLLRRQSLL